MKRRNKRAIKFNKWIESNPLHFCHSITTKNRIKVFLPEKSVGDNINLLNILRSKKWRVISRFAPKVHEIGNCNFGRCCLHILEK